MNLFSSLLNRPAETAAESCTSQTESREPRHHITDTPEAFQVRVEIPGVSRDSLRVESEQGVLSVTGSVPALKTEGAKIWYQEVDTAPYALRLRHDDQVDVSGIKADYADGVLQLTLPKVAAARPRRIEVSG